MSQSWTNRRRVRFHSLTRAQYVKPYVKTNKNDYIDAEAIAEAVQRPTMRFVPIKATISWIYKHFIGCGIAGSLDGRPS
jgi:hypothetical protein